MWQVYGFAAMVLLAAMLLVMKRITGSILSAGVILMYMFLGGFLFSAGHLAITRQSVKVGPWVLAMIAGAALLSFLGNLFYIKSLSLTPNPGYPAAIESCKALLILVVACLLMGAEFSMMKCAGAALCTAGVVMIVL